MRAYIRYDNKGNIVSSSLILMKNKPDVGDWVEVEVHKDTLTPPVRKTIYYRALIRYDSKHNIVPGTLIITRSVPSIGNWLEVPMKKQSPITTTTTTCIGEYIDAPAPTGVTITPDAVGSNPVTWYYRLLYADGIPPTFRSLFTEESSFTIGDSTTEIIMSGYVFPSWAIGGISIILGTTSGFYNYITGDSLGSPKDIYGIFVDPGYGNLYPLLLPVHIHQDWNGCGDEPTTTTTTTI